jgi:hypothetical protein
MLQINSCPVVRTWAPSRRGGITCTKGGHFPTRLSLYYLLCIEGISVLRICAPRLLTIISMSSCRAPLPPCIGFI